MKTLKLFSTLREVVGAKQIEIPFENGQTVRDLLQTVANAHPQLGAKILQPDGQLTGLVQVLVEGRNIDWLRGLDTTIAEGDDVVLLPPSAGG